VGFAVDTLLSNIVLVPEESYRPYMRVAVELMRGIDEKDSPFIACALALGLPLWSNDRALKAQQRVKVYSTDEILKNYL